MSLSSPASWAAEMNFQSRYPRGIVVTMICLASLVPVCVVTWPLLSCANDEGAIHAITPAAVTTATNKNAIAMPVIPRMNAELEGGGAYRFFEVNVWARRAKTTHNSAIIASI